MGRWRIGEWRSSGLFSLPLRQRHGNSNGPDGFTVPYSDPIGLGDDTTYRHTIRRFLRFEGFGAQAVGWVLGIWDLGFRTGRFSGWELPSLVGMGWMFD